MNLRRILTLNLVIALVALVVPVSQGATAQPPAFQSVMTEPVPTKVTEGNTDTYTQYLTWYNPDAETPKNRLYEMTITVTKDTEVRMSATNEYYGIGYNVQEGAYISGSYTVYNGETGSVMEIRPLNLATTASGRQIYRPSAGGYFTGTQTTAICYYTDLEIRGTICRVSPWWTFAVNPPQTTVYHSTLSEPVSDEYNRYIAIGYGDRASLYWVSIQRYQYQYTNAQSWEYEGQLQSQTLILTQSANYRLVYQVPTALDDLSYLQYVMQITEFDLQTGEYIRTKAYAGTAVSQTVDIDITDFGVDPAEITSINVWGVNLINDGNVINRLSCVWSQDPAFETWKASILTMLERIYDALTQDAEEVTIDENTSALDDLQNAESEAVVTDENGSEIKPAEGVAEALSEARQGLQEIAPGTQGVLGLMNSIFFQNPIILIPLITALSLGLVITILGKKKND